MTDMPSYNILVSDGLGEDGLALLRQAGTVTVNPRITPAELLDVLPGYDALIVRSRTKVTAQVLQAGSRLKVVGRAGVGVDNIDAAAAIQRGITVVNSPLAATVAVAEHTLGLMLALARQVPAADTTLKSGKWEKSAFMGSELNGKVLGLLGIGRIGARVTELALAFGMSAMAYDPYLSDEQIRQRQAVPASFEAVLQNADYISLHMPFTPQTLGMLGADQFSKMKAGVRLVCTARGGVLDEDALRIALDDGKVAGAALDVFAAEPPPPGSIAVHPKVIATPHIAAQTKEAQNRAAVSIAEEVIAVLEGRAPRWKVLSAD
jgi:D-3-phosphoglycerate dehydrogenase